MAEKGQKDGESSPLNKGDNSIYESSRENAQLKSDSEGSSHSKRKNKLFDTDQKSKNLDGYELVENGSKTTLDSERNTKRAESSDASKLSEQSMFPLKVIFFSLFASIGIVVSFSSLYLKETGLRAGEIGTVLFFRPLGGFVAGVVSPYIVAKFKNTETAVIFFAASFWGSLMCVSFIPGMRLAETCPSSDLPSYFSNLTNSTSSSNPLELSRADRSWMFQRQMVPGFMLFFIVFFFLQEFFFISVDTIIHAITMRTLGRGNSGSYGVIRSWGAIGHGVGASVTGGVVSLVIIKQKICGTLYETADYHYVFYVFSCFCVITCLTAGNLHEKPDPDRQTEGTMSNKELWKILGTFYNIVWLLVVFGRSMFYAVTQGFLYWHMENIGAAPALIGVANCITTTTEFLVFFATPKLIEVFGEWKLVMAGLVSYACRFVIFSQISNPLYILPVEVLEGVMYACIWSSIISYFSKQVPGEAQNQVQGLIQALYMLGLACGFLLSGALTEEIGAPGMFLVFGAIAAVSSAFFLFARVYLHKKEI